MHQVILQTHEAEVCPEPSLRMIANAAGGLLPSLAIQLRDKFGANVLPSYGMYPYRRPCRLFVLAGQATKAVVIFQKLSFRTQRFASRILFRKSHEMFSLVFLLSVLIHSIRND